MHSFIHSSIHPVTTIWTTIHPLFHLFIRLLKCFFICIGLCDTLRHFKQPHLKKRMVMCLKTWYFFIPVKCDISFISRFCTIELPEVRERGRFEERINKHRPALHLFQKLWLASTRCICKAVTSSGINNKCSVFTEQQTASPCLLNQ